MTFDDLWGQEELRGLTRRMRREYPVVQRRRRQGWAAVASLAVIAVVAVTAMPLSSAPRGYDAVSCNRNDYPDSHWADVAANMLTAEMT